MTFVRDSTGFSSWFTQGNGIAGFQTVRDWREIHGSKHKKGPKVELVVHHNDFSI
jgi:hypothetical protein